MVDDLVKTALIGTARGAVPTPPGPAEDVLSTLPVTDAESRLLDAVAVLSRYQTCGRVPAAAEPVPTPAPADVQPACSRRAADLLGGVLAMTDNSAKQQLLGEWLALANAAGRRVPHGMIPAVLDFAARHAAVHDATAAAVDQRGAWLMSLNPRWRVGVGDGEDPAAVWTVGTKDQRVSALRRLRATDPAAAVALVRSTWAGDGATERTAFVEALAVGLIYADEPFLEAALDDRSSLVRTAAVSLLARMPASALVRRMTGRADDLLTFADGKLTLALPAAFDPAWERDGVVEKGSRGQRQGWARQIIGVVPPTHWSTAWGIGPDAAVAAAPQDFAGLLHEAWGDAVVRHPDAGWASAILAVSRRIELLDGLPPDDQRAIAARLLRTSRAEADVLAVVVHHTRFAFDPPSAAVLFDRIDLYVDVHQGQPDYRLGPMLEAVALRVPPGSYDELVERWCGPKWEPYRKAADGSLSTLQVRRDIQREFSR